MSNGSRTLLILFFFSWHFSWDFGCHWALELSLLFVCENKRQKERNFEILSFFFVIFLSVILSVVIVSLSVCGNCVLLGGMMFFCIF